MGYYQLKILLAGDGAVGKSSIVNRFVKGSFKTDYSHTVGVDTHSKEMNINGDIIAKLLIWDVAGQEHYNFMRTNFYYGTDGVLLIFDLTRADTFEHVKDWLKEINQVLGDDVPFVLIGNKVDLIEDIGDVISHNEVMEFAEEQDVIYRETSAKTGLNVDIIFEDLTKIIIKARTYGVDLFQNLWDLKK